MGRKIITNEQKEMCVRWRREGRRLKDIAADIGVSQTAVNKVIARHAPDLIRTRSFSPVGVYRMRNTCPYPNLVKWMEENRVTPNALGRMACVGDGATIYSMLYGRTNLRKSSIDKLLEVTGLTYEQAFCKEQRDAE